jgi:phage-related protein (TIGR01555 family)
MQITDMARGLIEAARMDSWLNVFLGMGGERDPSAYTTYTKRAQLSDNVLEALYVQDQFAARIVEALPKNGLRSGWDLVIPGKPEEAQRSRDLFRAREDELEVAAELSQGACWGRLFGGALTWIGADDDRDQSLPLNESGIRSVRFLHTFDRRDVQIHSYYLDPRSPKFRRPETYLVRPHLLVAVGNAVGAIASGTSLTPDRLAGGVVIHESRCLVWGGQPTTDTRRLELAGWDDSILERCWDALKQLGEDYGAKTLLLGRISQLIIKIKDLWDLVAGKQDEVLNRRMRLFDLSRARSRTLLIDKEEDVAQVTQPIAGVDGLMGMAIERVAAAAPMPKSILMGQSPDGSEGAESDQELWEAQTIEWQTLELRKRHEKLARILLLAKDGPTGGLEPDAWLIEYRPVRSPRPKEIAELRKIQVETDALRVDKGFATPEAIALARHSPSAGSDLVLDEDELRAAVERRRELANQPPKDNAELGTVGARDQALQELQTAFYEDRIPEEAALARLELVFRFKPEDAKRIIARPTGWKPAAKQGDGTPGPDPDPKVGEGAGRPPAIPGVDDGGDPRKEPVIP